MNPTDLPTINDINTAAILLKKKNIHSSLINFAKNIFLKLECQLPSGSYKIRGVEYYAACNDIPCHLQVLSAGNLALAAAQCLKAKNIKCEAIVPEGISQIKRQELEKLGASIQERSFAQIWEIVLESKLRQSQQLLHPFNKYFLAGYATIIVELLEANAGGILIIPYGLGGLALALAHAIEILKADIQLVICEIAGAAPYARAKKANRSITGAKLQSFIEAMGTPHVIDDVFHFLKKTCSRSG